MLKQFATLLLLGCSPLVLFAGNTAVNGVATRAETLQAFTGLADDPSAIYYNPAGLTQIKGTDIEGDLIYIRPNLQYTNSLNGVDTQSTKAIKGANLFISSDKLKPVVLGFGMYAPFARETYYDVNAAVFNLTQSAKMTRVDFVPTIAYAINRYISAGVGLVGSRVDIANDVLSFDEEATGYGATAQGGILIIPIDNVRVGINYRGPESAYVSGEGTLGNTPVGPISGGFDADVKFPGTLSAGISWQIVQQFLISAEYDDEMWSYVDKLNRNYSNGLLATIAQSPINGQNSNDYRIGALYKPFPNDEFRAGYSFLQEAIPAVNIIPAQPDYDVSVFSLGYSHYIRQWRLDAGYEYATSPSHNSNSPFFPGQYKLQANLFLLGINYTFA